MTNQKSVKVKKFKRRVVLGIGWPIYQQNYDKTAYSWIGLEENLSRKMKPFKLLGATKIRLIAEIIE